MAWVVIENKKILLRESQHLLVSGKQGVAESAEFHLLRDCDRQQGIHIEQLMPLFLKAATAAVLVFHHAGLDLAFLNKLSRRCCGAPLLLPSLDTLIIERNKLEQRDQPIREGDLRLGACRQRYSLPVYPAHNAFNDALATAELFLAQERS